MTVNSGESGNIADDRLTLSEAVLFLNSEFADSEEAPRLGRALTPAEAAQAVEYTEEEGRSLIEFAIPGAGDHFIKAPDGGFPALYVDGVLVDGFSQPGANPNSNPITAANNAVLKVVLDARELSGVNGEPPPDYTFKINARGVRFRGFSVLASTMSDNFGVDFGGGSEGGQISGCWFGVSPDRTILSGGEVAVAAFGTEGGHVVGTNGDGVEDRAEFNVIVAHAIGVMFEETRDIKVAGNFIGVLPDGITLPSAEIRDGLEGDAIEGADLEGTVTVGTDSDGVADADESNLIGGMKDDVVELYGNADRVVFAGNRVGVGVDGTTPLPIHKLFRTRAGHFRIGSDLNRVRDDIEANWIANADSFLVRYAAGAFFEVRGNRVTAHSGEWVSALEDSHLAGILGRETDLAPLLVSGEDGTRILATVPLSGPGANGLLPAVLDIYQAEIAPDGSTNLFPQDSVTDNGPSDRNPAVGAFDVIVGGWFPVGVSTGIAAICRIEDSAGAETGPISNLVLVEVQPTLDATHDGGELVFHWSGPEYRLETSPSLDPTAWSRVEGTSPVRIRPNEGAAYFRLRRP